MNRRSAAPHPAVKSQDIDSRVDEVVTTAARHAPEVDEQARFPQEALAAAKSQRLLGIMVPRELGGEEADISAVADICYRLGRACGSTALIYAMHQVKLACLIDPIRTNRWQQQLLRRVAEEQLLLASSTTEGAAGANIRSSAAAIVQQGSRITLDRSATCVSYGAAADAIVTTARRAEDAAASDQVLVVFMKEDYTLEPIVPWNVLGMRGTASVGYRLKATGALDQILPEPYAKIHVRGMVPAAGITWSAAWAGIAADAVERARQFSRAAARHSEGRLPPGAAHLTQALGQLENLRALIASAARRYEQVRRDEHLVEAPDFQTAMTLLKVNASELALGIVMNCLRACGLSGFRTDSEFSICRNLRDILSSPIMINNDRILASLGGFSLMSQVPDRLID
jgi:acyl-CoA dehydrogenase